jgi:hypothetical protein
MIRLAWIPRLLGAFLFFFGTVSGAGDDQPRGPCAQVIAACQKAGFVRGGTNSRNRLQIDCIQPIMQGKVAEYKAGKPLPELDSQLLVACRARNPRFGQPQAPPSGAGQPQAHPATDWPKELDADGTHFIIYQPQAENWKDGQLQASSVLMISEGGGKPRYGTVTLTANTKEDQEHRTVTLENVTVTSADFPSGASDMERALKQIQQHLAEWPRTISLDRLRAEVGITEAEKAGNAVPLRNAPARIIFSPRPAVLVQVDGEPVFRPVEGSNYQRVINTPAMILQDASSQRLYLDGDGRWMTATALNGPWSQAQPAPADLDRVKSELNRAEQGDQQEAAPARTPTAANSQRLHMPPVAPTLYVTTSPTELIQTKGRPQFSPIPNTQLTYVSNSDNDIFLYLPTQAYYTLLSGRWFTARDMGGDWTPVASSELPQDFAKIPAASTKASVLASVPGTTQARQAVINSQVPQTAGVKRNEAKLNVRYEGEPQFKPIEGTSLDYAVNTSSEVIHAGGNYYACHDAVWFVATTPNGPWAVADNIPAEIYRIPASSPLYHVRYVRVYNATPEWVYFGYTPGYLGAYVWNGVVVYGTGWAYPGWYGRYYYGWPWTWGLGFRYGYWGGGWFWRPWGGWWYGHPWWGARAWYGGWWGHGWAGNRVWVQNNVNVYNRWGGNNLVTRNVQTTTARAARSNIAQTARTAAQKSPAHAQPRTAPAHADHPRTARETGPRHGAGRGMRSAGMARGGGRRR